MIGKHSRLGLIGRFVWNATDGKAVWMVVLSLLSAATEGISIMMLIPIAAATNPGTAATANDIPVIGPLLSSTTFDLPVLLGIFVVLVCGQAILNFAKSVYSLRMMQDASDHLKFHLFEALANASWSAIATRRLSDLNEMLTGGIPRCMTAANALLAIVQACILVVIYVALAAAVSWQMALFAATVGFGLFALMFPLRRHATKHGQDLIKLFEQQSHVTLEFLNGVRLAKSFVAERRFVSSFNQHLRIIRTNTLRFQSWSVSGTLLFQIAVALIAAAFVYLAVVQFDLQIAEIAVLLLIFARLTPRFNAIQDQSQQFLANAPAYSHYEATLDFFQREREEDSALTTAFPRLEDKIVLEDVTVSYSQTAAPSVNSASIAIAAGRVTALIGPSGSGKSTLADLILGLTQPHEGTIVIDSVPIDAGNRRSWRSSVASVPQDPFLLNDTIANNLRLGAPDASEDELWAALEKANVSDLIRALPEELDTMVGDRGARFSGGERQRIALARALLKKPQLLVLDEATSALDWQNQQIIGAAIKSLRGQLTIITIAHRASLIAFADDIIAMDKGRIVESGPYAALAEDRDSVLSRMLAGDTSL